ncbi:DUF881 domain-containing protein [Paractinoplanes durhamensis]|uniref:DUF881 domain-containing protein n=1 Tax=Paractinoplanes durhamensis TaxID=113563 RepID=A0ABQ3YTV1_9ACTN|nr:DUF881 domain-containing protein [Actinoplanes durhamensis]GIE00981.1 hypothetical protein Adu01nite_23310 [Actinoplanes durhamensis]
MNNDDEQNPDFPTAGRRPPHAEKPEESTPGAADNRTSDAAEKPRVQSMPRTDEATAPSARPPAPPADDEATARLSGLSPGTGAGPGPDDEVTARLSGLSGAPSPERPVGEVTTRLDGPVGEGPTAPLARPARDPDGPTRRISVSPDPVTPEKKDAASTAAEAGSASTTDAGTGAEDVPEEEAQAEAAPQPAESAKRRFSSAGALICFLLALFGFTLVVQLRSNDGDQGLATMRQEDLVRILSDLDSSDSRLQSQISALEASQRQLSSGVAGRQAALAEAEKRADELGLLAGTLPGRGPGLVITVDRVKASAILNAVQELRGAGGEVLQLGGSNGQAVRVVASSYFVDAEGGGILADGVKLSAPYVLSVIGSPQTMQTALQIPGGVVASVNSGGGSVTMEQRATVEVTAVRKATTLQYARPAS